MIELAILLHFLTRDAYVNYQEYIDLDYIKENVPDVYYLYRSLSIYYESHPDSTGLTPDMLLVHTFTQFPSLKQQDQDSIRASVDAMKDMDQGLIIDLLEKYKEKAVATKIIQEAVLVVGGKKDFSAITDLLKLKDEAIVSSEVDTCLVDMNLDNLISKAFNPDGLQWPLECLNRAMGPLTLGRFGFVFARPETGKTTFLAHCVMHMAKQMELDDDGAGGILWCNNEEEGSSVGARCYQAFFGVTVENLSEHSGKFKELWQAEGMPDKFKLYDDAAMSRSSIEKRLAKYRPKLIILDQIDKIHGFQADRHDLLMKKIYQWAREISKKYGPVIAVCQAGASGENKKWLEYTDVDSSHTAKQGEADFIIGIGRVNDSGLEYNRYLHVSKNKLPPGPRTLADLRHGRFTVTIDPLKARYLDTIRDFN